MTAKHPHVSDLDALLARYVLGDVAEPVRVLFDAHLELSESSRGFVCDLEALAGHALEASDPETLDDREARLAAIFSGQGPAEEPTRAGKEGPYPSALKAYLGDVLSDVPWRRLLPGLKGHRIRDAGGTDATLYWIRAGHTVPNHTHGGTEITLVLQGGFSDVTGHYRRGDVAVADDGIDHRPMADDDEDCICFSVTDAPLRLTGSIGRFFAPFMKR